MFGWVFKIQGRRLGRWNGPKQAKTEIAIKKIPPGFTSENFHSVLTTPIQNKYKKISFSIFFLGQKPMATRLYIIVCIGLFLCNIAKKVLNIAIYPKFNTV